MRRLMCSTVYCCGREGFRHREAEFALDGVFAVFFLNAFNWSFQKEYDFLCYRFPANLCATLEHMSGVINIVHQLCVIIVQLQYRVSP